MQQNNQQEGLCPLPLHTASCVMFLSEGQVGSEMVLYPVSPLGHLISKLPVILLHSPLLPKEKKKREERRKI